MYYFFFMERPRSSRSPGRGSENFIPQSIAIDTKDLETALKIGRRRIKNLFGERKIELGVMSDEVLRLLIAGELSVGDIQ